MCKIYDETDFKNNKADNLEQLTCLSREPRAGNLLPNYVPEVKSSEEMRMLRRGEEHLAPPNIVVATLVYALGLREWMELDLEARLMGKALILNRSEDPEFGDFIELNNVNEPLELTNHEIENLGPTIEE
ncbi:hypothetical protein Tco_0897086, partial [Tanacetum coccineum]